MAEIDIEALLVRAANLSQPALDAPEIERARCLVISQLVWAINRMREKAPC